MLGTAGTVFPEQEGKLLKEANICHTKGTAVCIF